MESILVSLAVTVIGGIIVAMFVRYLLRREPKSQIRIGIHPRVEFSYPKDFRELLIKKGIFSTNDYCGYIYSIQRISGSSGSVEISTNSLPYSVNIYPQHNEEFQKRGEFYILEINPQSGKVYEISFVTANFTRPSVICKDASSDIIKFNYRIPKEEYSAISLLRDTSTGLIIALIMLSLYWGVYHIGYNYYSEKESQNYETGVEDDDASIP